MPRTPLQETPRLLRERRQCTNLLDARTVAGVGYTCYAFIPLRQPFVGVGGEHIWSENRTVPVAPARQRARLYRWETEFVSERSIKKWKFMDITSMAIIPLLLGSVGVFGLYKLLQRLRTRAYIQDAVVVITGATSGLGKECAKVFYRAGARLVLCGRDKEKLEDLARELNTAGRKNEKMHKPHMVIFDLADVESVASAAEEILKSVGNVDILINNAGISYRGTILDTGVDVDKMVMETNYFGPIALTKAILPSMIKKRAGHIVVISSVQGKISIPFRSAYAASKHATQAFFDCLRAEMEPYEIDVTVVSPGYIQTNLSLNAVTADGSRYGVMDKSTAEGMSAADVAMAVFSAVGEKKKDVLLAGLMPTLAVYLRTLAPKLFFSLMASRAKKERKVKGS